MLIRKLSILLFISIFFVSCSSSYEFLSKNPFDPPDDFSKYLLKEYQHKADFEAKEMHDWNSAKLYSEKALKAVDGIRLEPETISYWKIPEQHHAELEKAYDNLMKVYGTAIETNPYDLAVAISSLDCWAEQQEENWQTWDIEDCKNDYLNSIHNIYNTISDNEKNKADLIDNDESKADITTKDASDDSVVVVTKDKNEEIKQIIYFDFDKSNLTNVSLQEIKNFLIQYQSEITKYLIVGHTDTKGTNEYNLKLSLDRATIVQNILIESGINKNDIKIIAKGENELAVKTNDEIAHPANRRAEISPIN